MPRSKFIKYCPNGCKNKDGTPKVFRESRKYKKHIGMNARSGKPVCPIARKKLDNKCKAIKEKIIKEEKDDFILNNGLLVVKKDLIKDRWFNYLFHRFGKSYQDYEKYVELLTSVKEKLRKKNKNYFRWFKRSKEGINARYIDYSQEHYNYVYGKDEYTTPTQNPNYIGKGVYQKHIQQEVFKILLKDFDPKFVSHMNVIKGFRQEIMRSSQLLGLYNDKSWNCLIDDNEDNQCDWCFEMYVKPQAIWKTKFRNRHPNALTKLQSEYKGKLVFDNVCGCCKEEAIEEEPDIIFDLPYT